MDSYNDDSQSDNISIVSMKDYRIRSHSLPVRKLKNLCEEKIKFSCSSFTPRPTRRTRQVSGRIREERRMSVIFFHKTLSGGEKMIIWCFRKFKIFGSKWFSHLCLFLCLISFTVFGACLFYYIEGSAEDETLKQFYKERIKVINEIKQILIDNDEETPIDMYEGNLTTQLRNFDFKIIEWYKLKPLIILSEHKIWHFVNSLFFCGCIYSTVGYGIYYPVTKLGKVTLLFYIAFGVPMFLLFVSDFEKLIQKLINFFWKYGRRLYKTGSFKEDEKTKQIREFMLRFGNEENTIDKENEVPFLVDIGIIIVYMLIGSAFYSIAQDWTYFDSFYYVYTCMMTCGSRANAPTKPIVMIVSLIYLFFGLALTIMAIDLGQDKLRNALKKSSTRIRASMAFYGFSEDNQTLEEPGTSKVEPMNTTTKRLAINFDVF